MLELLYTATEGRYVDLLVSEGTRTREVRLELKPFTLIAAMTDEDRLPLPLLSRFDYQIELEPLGDATMNELCERAASRQGAVLDQEARTQLVRASLGIPRRALSLISEAEKAAKTRGSTRIEITDARRGLEVKGLDERGFSRVQRKILEMLCGYGKPMGLEHFAARLGKAAQAILELYEPDLLRAGCVLRTPFGRTVPDSKRPTWVTGG